MDGVKKIKELINSIINLILMFGFTLISDFMSDETYYKWCKKLEERVEQNGN